jgi:hypothetical protein
VGDPQVAAEKYAALIKTYPGPEAKLGYALLLGSMGDHAGSRALFEEIVADSKISGRHFNTLFKDWVKQAKAELARPLV